MLSTIEIQPSELTDECHLYHVCKPEDTGDYSKGYIGISTDPETRWKNHKAGHSGSKLLNRAYKKYPVLLETVIMSGSKESCKYFEMMLRPDPKIGWNLIEGGGLPPNLSGKVMSQEQKDKIGVSNGGANNVKWKGYWQVDGVNYISMNSAASAVGCCKKSVRDRALSDKYPNYRFIPADEICHPTFRTDR